MELALKQAWKYQFLTYPNPAVGAVVVKNGAILGIGAHREAGGPHAEVYAIKTAFEQITQTPIPHTQSSKIHEYLLQNHNGLFQGCTIYTTLEPCNHVGKTPSCANLIQKLGFDRVVIGTPDHNEIAAGGRKRFANVTVGVLRQRCEELLEPFYIWQKRAFVFFKLAQTHNGKISGGYLSCKDSLTHVHKLRTKITKLLIGGNTVAVDRPTLDSRFVEGKAPDVRIYSKREFDPQISLFSVKGREVRVSKELGFLNSPGLVMVEGGENMLKSLQQNLDWVLTFQTPDFSENRGYDVTLKTRHLHLEPMDRDVMIYSKVMNG